jgi:tetratricopeptide (TPR) repeat protein
VREVRDALERWNPADAAPSMFLIFAMHNDLHPAIRAYLLGLLDLRLGDLAAAAGRLETLAELEAGGPELWFQLTVASPFFSLASQRFLRARLLEAVGRRAEAAGWYRAIAQRSPYELIYAREAAERVERVERVERTE